MENGVNSQPHHCPAISPLHFKCPGVGSMAFTWTQYKEMERQALIFKYMMASVPVPPELLTPISDAYSAAHNTSATHHFHAQSMSGGGVVGVGYSGKNRDLEPGRCKRTDGKKWRCSKEVAPNQKYCERHLHRGRPRSRKPVEDQTLIANSKKSRLQLESPSMVISQPPPPPAPPTGPSSSSQSFNEPTHRSVDWEQWQELMDTNTRLCFGNNVYRDDYAQAFQPMMNFFDSKDFDDGIRNNGVCNPYFNSELGSLDKEFINAWSNGNFTNNSNTNADTGSCVSASSLSLSVNILDNDNDNNNCSNTTWRSSRVSWDSFASGGPLAEVLKSSQHQHQNSSSYISNGDSGNSVSSPSGVLQKTALLSDGSVCNSPTLADIVPFQWPT